MVSHVRYSAFRISLSAHKNQAKIKSKWKSCALRRCFVLFYANTHTLAFALALSFTFHPIFGVSISFSTHFFTISHELVCYRFWIVCVRMPLSSYFMQKYFLCDAESFTISPVLAHIEIHLNVLLSERWHSLYMHRTSTNTHRFSLYTKHINAIAKTKDTSSARKHTFWWRYCCCFSFHCCCCCPLHLPHTFRVHVHRTHINTGENKMSEHLLFDILLRSLNLHNHCLLHCFLHRLAFFLRFFLLLLYSTQLSSLILYCFVFVLSTSM